MNIESVKALYQLPEQQRDVMYKLLENAQHGVVEKVVIEDENSEASAEEKEAHRGTKFYSIFLVACTFENLEEAIRLAPHNTHFDSFGDADGMSYLRITFYN